MAAPAASPPASISFSYANNEELCIFIYKLRSGSPLPSNVIDYVNPFGCEPKNLPDAVWFLINPKDNIYPEHGFWETKEEACEVFSNSDIIGWRTTHEYYDGHVPHQQKTDWVMQVFSITLKRLCDGNEIKETSSLCRVYLVPSHDMQQKVSAAGVDNETRNHLTPAPDLDAYGNTRIGSSSNPQVNKHDEAEALAVAERLPVQEHQGENRFEMDLLSRDQTDFFEEGDFLELQDLDNPASPSSSSENSSARSISSEEYFDLMALLQELEDKGLDQNDAGKKLNALAANKPDEVVIVPATVGSSNSSSDDFFKTAGSAHVSASGSRDMNNNVAKHAKVDQRVEGPSSSSDHKPSTPADGQTAAASGRKGATSGGKKQLTKKYLRYMPY